MACSGPWNMTEMGSSSQSSYALQIESLGSLGDSLQKRPETETIPGVSSRNRDYILALTLLDVQKQRASGWSLVP